MMTVKLQIVVGLAILFILAILINMIRRRSLELKYALVWMLVLTALFVFDCAPALLNVVSGFLGIYAPVNMIFFLGFCFFSAHYLFTDGGIVPPVQQCAYPGSDGGTQ
mgnify:CR=1 FL=1